MKLRPIIGAIVVAMLAIGGGYKLLTLQDHIMDLRQAGKPLDIKDLKRGDTVRVVMQVQTHKVDDLNRSKQGWRKSTFETWILVDESKALDIDGLTPVRKVVTGSGGTVYSEQILNREVHFVGFPQMGLAQAVRRPASATGQATDEQTFRRLLEVEGTSLIRTVIYPGGEAYQMRMVYPASDSELGIVDRYFDKRTFWPLATEEWRSRFLGLSQRLLYRTINRRFQRPAAAKSAGFFSSPKGVQAREFNAKPAKPARAMSLKAFKTRAPRPEVPVYAPAKAPRSFKAPTVVDDRANPQFPSVALQYLRPGRRQAQIEVISGWHVPVEMLGAANPVKKQVFLRLPNLDGRPAVKAFILNAPAEADDHASAIVFKISETWVAVRAGRRQPTESWLAAEAAPSWKTVGLLSSDQLIKLASTLKKL